MPRPPMPRPLGPALALGLALAAAPALAEEVRLPHAGLTLNASLERVGSDWTRGPVVLITHGTLAHAGMEIVAGLQAGLKERGISSLAINLSLGLDDRHGMYDCAVPHTHRHTDAMAEIGAWLAWLKGQGVGPVALLGHSRGGNQTARFAADHPQVGLSAVILLAPQTWDAAGAAADYQTRYGQPLAPLVEQARARAAAGRGAEPQGPVDFIYCKGTQASADAVLSYYGGDPDLDTPAVIPRITAPVLVIAGGDDQVVKGLVEKVRPLADGQRVRLQVIEGADHFFRDLYLEETADAVAQALGR